jgi:hypothetical protein
VPECSCAGDGGPPGGQVEQQQCGCPRQAAAVGVRACHAPIRAGGAEEQHGCGAGRTCTARVDCAMEQHTGIRTCWLGGVRWKARDARLARPLRGRRGHTLSARAQHDEGRAAEHRHSPLHDGRGDWRSERASCVRGWLAVWLSLRILCLALLCTAHALAYVVTWGVVCCVRWDGAECAGRNV